MVNNIIKGTDWIFFLRKMHRNTNKKGNPFPNAAIVWLFLLQIRVGTIVIKGEIDIIETLCFVLYFQ